MSFNKFKQSVWSLSRYQKLLKVPRQYANQLRVEDIDPDSALIMGRSSARSRENVQALLKLYKVTTVDELLVLLPDQRYKRRPLARIWALARRMLRATAYDPDKARIRELKRAGHFNKQHIHARVQSVKEFE